MSRVIQPAQACPICGSANSGKPNCKRCGADLLDAVALQATADEVGSGGAADAELELEPTNRARSFGTAAWLVAACLLLVAIFVRDWWNQSQTEAYNGKRLTYSHSVGLRHEVSCNDRGCSTSPYDGDDKHVAKSRRTFYAGLITCALLVAGPLFMRIRSKNGRLDRQQVIGLAAVVGIASVITLVLAVGVYSGRPDYLRREGQHLGVGFPLAMLSALLAIVGSGLIVRRHHPSSGEGERT